VTELQRMYAEARRRGLRHRAAIGELARQLGVDQETVRRVLGEADAAIGHGSGVRGSGHGRPVPRCEATRR
jgi:hypothetical protein